MATPYMHAGAGDLPWGWWLRIEGGRIHDADGREWKDVREAFWEGRLGLRAEHLAADQQMLLLRVLGSVEARWLPPGESKHDLFGGDMSFWRFYMCWLGSVGLLDLGSNRLGMSGSVLDAPLSAEGRAALLMLRATRNPVWDDLPMPELVEAVHRAGRDGADDAREAALRAFERGMTPLLHLFARERAGRAHLVTLTSIDPRDRMPSRRVAWSASFLDARPRDDLFGWLAERVHRWEDWGEVARLKGARGLTAHLLTLLVVSPIARMSLDDGRRSTS